MSPVKILVENALLPPSKVFPKFEFIRNEVDVAGQLVATDNGSYRFEGDMEKSAEIFCDYVCEKINERLKQHGWIQ